jgi:hypothetical protein
MTICGERNFHPLPLSAMTRGLWQVAGVLLKNGWARSYLTRAFGRTEPSAQDEESLIFKNCEYFIPTWRYESLRARSHVFGTQINFIS